MSARSRLPNRRNHDVVEFEHSGFQFVAGLGHFEGARLRKIFLRARQTGTSIDVVRRVDPRTATPGSPDIAQLNPAFADPITRAGSPAYHEKT